MKNFIKIVKIIAVIGTILIGLIFIKWSIAAFNTIIIINDNFGIDYTMYMLVVLPTIIASVIGPVVLLIFSIIFIPKIFKYLTYLDKNPTMCTKKEILKIILVLIILLMLIGIITVILINIK